MWPPEWITVDDELVLRVWEPSDAPALCRAVTESLEHLRPFMPWAAFEPQTVARREALIETWAEERRLTGETIYGIFEQDRIAGGTGIHARSVPSTREIGYWVHVDATRRGIARRVAARLTTEALRLDGVDTVEIRHDRNNVASGRVPARLGYRLVEEAWHPRDAPGVWGIMHRWRITADEWARHTTG